MSSSKRNMEATGATRASPASGSPASASAPAEAGARTLAARLKARARELGFERAGIARLGPSAHADFYRAWLDAGYHGEMAYLARPDAVARRLNPTASHVADAQDAPHVPGMPQAQGAHARESRHGVQGADPTLRSALVVAHHYFPGDQDGASTLDPACAVIARYARGRDYHRVIKGKLIELLRWLEAEVGHALPAARASVDTAPVLERELAQRAGLGWFGRNTMLIDPRAGSWFFLGTLLLELELEPDPPFLEDRCGTCRACLDACPTGALLGRDGTGAPVIDARRCISYLTIELRGPIPRELRPLIGNRVFGCDECQECCPWNGDKLVRLTREEGYLARQGLGLGLGQGQGSTTGFVPGTNAPRLLDLIAMDEAAWDEFSRGSAIRRARRAGFLRNVAVALGNWGSPDAVPALVRALDDPEPLVRGHAAWALGQTGAAEVRAALKARLQLERDGWVREEIAAVLDGPAA